MQGKERRQRSALARLEAKLPSTLTIPLDQEQQTLWREILRIRTNLGEMNGTHNAIAKLLRPSDRRDH